MKRVVIVLASVMIAACAGGNQRSSSLIRVKEFEGGTLYRTAAQDGAGHFNVAELRGGYREMGRQYGGLLGREMREYYALLMSGEAGERYQETKAFAYTTFNSFPPRIQEIVLGAAETSGLGVDQQVIVSAGVMLIAGGAAGCSGMGVWGAYSTDGRTVFGRNWDLNKGLFTKYAPYLTVTVYNPSDGRNSVADVNYIGSIIFQSGMNSRGLFIDLQNGLMSDRGEDPSAPNSNAALLSFLFDQSNMEGMTRAFETTPSEGGIIANVASEDIAYSFEWPVHGVERREPDKPGVIAVTNHFVDPAWTNLPPLPPPGLASGYTRERRANLLAQAEERKGTIDDVHMMAIFDTLIPDGGPTFPDDTPGVQTYYQMVAVPSARVLYLKARDYSGWERIDLAEVF